MLWIAFLATLTWTNPSMSQDTIGCGPGPLPCLDLATVEVWGRRQWALEDSLIGTVNVARRGGRRESFSLGLFGIWSVWTIAVDSTGNTSCPSQPVGVNLIAGAPEAVWAREWWFDVAGRRLAQRPVLPGIYFRARQGSVRRIVIVR